MSEVRFTFDLSGVDCALRDVDVAENGSASDVVVRMKQEGSLRRVLEEWNLLDQLTVYVEVVNDNGISTDQWTDWL